MKDGNNEIVQKRNNIDSFKGLLSASGSVQFVNALTLYRTLAFPLLIALILADRMDIFRWLLIVSFLTDAVDGLIARKLKATSTLGSILDSIGDDLTILAGVVGVVVFKIEFLREEIVIILVQLGLFLIQIVAALIRYGKISSFHTYLAKGAAIAQGFFLCSLFLFDEPAYWLFYTASLITTLELIEEIVIVAILPRWEANVKGLYWILQSRKRHAG